MLKENKNNIIEGSAGKPILIDWCYEESQKKLPVVIFVHGFKGFKDWGHFNLLAKTIAEVGFVFVKFNFSHNGTSIQQPEELVDLESFGKNNYTIELDDLECVIDWVLNNQSLKEQIDKENIYLLGHSRGGGVCILKAAEDKRIKKIVTWAAVSDFIGRLNQFPLSEWKEKGVIFTANARTGQNLPLYYSLYENAMEGKDRFNVLKNAEKIAIPCLIIHGTKDEAVPVGEAYALHNHIENSEILLLEKSGHTFGVKHPFTDTVFSGDALEVIQKTICFLKK